MSNKVLDNLQRLRAMVAAYPEKNIYLERFCKEGRECGTLYCVAGLMSMNEHFQLQGYKLEDEGSPTRAFWIVNRNGVNIFEADNTDTFGYDAYRRLFEQRGEGYWDAEVLGWEDETSGYINYDSPVTDKELALFRIDKQIAEYENVSV